MRIPALVVITLLAMLTLAAPAHCAVVYVNLSSPNDGPGNDWDHAYHKVAAALTAAVSGGEVWVAKGVYVERITLKSGVGLYGGFAGTETARDQRNWVTNVTVLDGNQGGDVVTSPSGAIASTRIDGFTTRNGNSGAGVRCNSSSLTMANDTICLNNGGGIACSNSSVTIDNCSITLNNGDGVYLSGGSASVSNTTVAFNSGYGVRMASGVSTVANTIIAFNVRGLYAGSAASTTLGHNCVYGNTIGNYYGVTDLTGVAGNICADPKFASLEYRNCHIQPDSPCVGAGDNTFVHGDCDIDGQPRTQPASGAVDIGADESDGTVWPAGPYAIVRVSTEGNDSNDGSSWNAAKRTVQAGLNAAHLQCGAVWVKAGTYYERIGLRPFSKLYGGFAGSETREDQRNWISNVTILDGQQGGSVVTAGGLYWVHTIDGLTIKNGVGTLGGGYRGGGITCSSPIGISNCVITDNRADFGGGIYCTGGAAPHISGNLITRNTVTTFGGGIDCENGSLAIIEGNVISYNTSPTFCGAGIQLLQSSATVVGNRIEYNTAYFASAGIDTNTSGTSGGKDCSPTISNNIFRGNVVTKQPVSLADGGAALWTFGGSPLVTNNTFVDNRAGSTGSTIWLQNSTGKFANNILAFNSSGIYGFPAIGTPIFTNNCFYGNTGYNYSGVPAGTNDVLSDPLLADWANGDYHLTAASPCINKGWNGAPGLQPMDFDGEARINRGIVDIGADECWLVPGTPADARMAANGAKVTLGQTTVSAAFPDFFYLESDQRISGIRVSEPGHALRAGMRADVAGSIQLNDDGETYIDASTAAQSAAPNDTGVVSPLVLNNRILGGTGTRAYQTILSNDVWSRTLADVPGIGNVGLLVTVLGKVAWTSADCFYLNDGSNCDDFSIPNPVSDQPPGVKVLMPAGGTLPQVGSYVSVTGISSCYKTDNVVFRLLRVSKTQDVTSVAQ